MQFVVSLEKVLVLCHHIDSMYSTLCLCYKKRNYTKYMRDDSHSSRSCYIQELKTKASGLRARFSEAIL